MRFESHYYLFKALQMFCLYDFLKLLLVSVCFVQKGIQSSFSEVEGLNEKAEEEGEEVHDF